MGDLDDVAQGYLAKYGDPVQDRGRLRDLYSRYVHRRETTILDAVSATAAIDALVLSDELDLDAVTEMF